MHFMHMHLTCRHTFIASEFLSHNFIIQQWSEPDWNHLLIVDGIRPRLAYKYY